MSTLAERTYRLLREVPAGKVTTYKNLALRLNTKAYRAIGQILRRNPYAPEVPCHRVIRSDGSIGGFNGRTSGPEVQRKIKLLQQEGVKVKNGKVINFTKIDFLKNHHLKQSAIENNNS